MTIARIADATGIAFREADDHFEAQGAKDAAVNAAGALNTVATSLMKIADDVRWLGSGPTSTDWSWPSTTWRATPPVSPTSGATSTRSPRRT